MEDLLRNAAGFANLLLNFECLIRITTIRIIRKNAEHKKWTSAAVRGPLPVRNFLFEEIIIGQTTNLLESSRY